MILSFRWILKWHCLKDFLGNEVGKNQSDAYTSFIDTFLHYQRLFNYSGSIGEIMDLPYCLYYDLIYKQIKLKNKEREQEARNNRR